MFVVHGLWNAFRMLWEVWWALVLGFTLSGIVQAWVPRARLQRAMGGAGAKDPMCGMTVDRVETPYRTVRDGQTFYFCSAHCRHRFEANETPAPEHAPLAHAHHD